MTIPQPQETEFAPFYAGYIAKVSTTGPIALLENQLDAFDMLRKVPADESNHRYAHDKWSVKEVVGHVADAERVFSYRLLRIARADVTPLAGFDENAWAKTAPHGNRRLADVADELIAVRKATITLVASLDEAALSRTALANNKPVSARAICWIIPGHAQHHLDVLRERYGVKV
jgi:uncharacterized damage-inducible protein DinB